MTTFADVAAGVRDTIAAYAMAVDDGRVEDVVATFCPDGLVDLPVVGTAAGHDAIRNLFSGLKPHRTRHLVVNTHVTEWGDGRAVAVSDLVVLGAPGWAVAMVGRYSDALHYDDGRCRFHSRKLEFTDLWMTHAGWS
ncbi:MAG: nuclear transport factor 2 family protein [Streptosporangiaceae bacterium]|jgi:ketosteroid isomerase-like protein